MLYSVFTFYRILSLYDENGQTRQLFQFFLVLDKKISICVQHEFGW